MSFSAFGHRMKEQIAAFESARRAVSYLGSAAAMAFAPSTPIMFSRSLSVFSGALTKPSRNEQRKENGRVSERRVHHSKVHDELYLTSAAPPR